MAQRFQNVDLLQVSIAEKTGDGKKRERLVILGMLINIHELSSSASIFKMKGLLSTVLSKLELAIVKEHRRASLCCKHMIGYCFLEKDSNWTESCLASDPGYEVLQVSLAFIPTLVFATRETCSKSILAKILGEITPS